MTSRDTAAERFWAPGPHAVATLLDDWHDAARGRSVPVKIYYPALPADDSVETARCPVVVVSHGLGGSRQGYAYLGQHWASHGYVSLHLQHTGSDTAVWKDVDNPRETMRDAAQNPVNARQRLFDVHFALDRLEQLDEGDGPLAARLDFTRVGVAGHSMGAGTVLGVSGQTYVEPDGRHLHFGDPRIKAFIVLSSPVRRKKDQPRPFDVMFGSIRLPGLHMTGTRDVSPIGLTAVDDRRIPYDHITAAEQYLVVFIDGNHMTFSDHRRPGGLAPRDVRFQEVIRQGTLAFWEAYLRDDAAARQWVAGAGLAAALADHATLERKPLPPDRL